MIHTSTIETVEEAEADLHLIHIPENIKNKLTIIIQVNITKNMIQKDKIIIKINILINIKEMIN